MVYKPKDKGYHYEYEEDEQLRAVRLGTLARVYQGADRILTGDPLVVNIVDSGPAPAWSDGQTITLNGEYITEMDLETLTQINGLNFHELAHHLYTPRRGTPLVTWVIEENLFNAFNVLEDQRIETLLTARYPSIIPWLEASVLRYLADTPMEAVANYLVVRGRRYLPREVRQGFRDIFYKPELIPDCIRIVDEYRLLAFPRDYERAKELIAEFNELIMKHVDINISGGPAKCGHRAPIQKGRPEPGKMQELDARKAGNMGTAESPYKPKDGLERQAMDEAAKNLETMQGRGNVDRPKEPKEKGSELGLTAEEALAMREESIYAAQDIGNQHNPSEGGIPEHLQETLHNALNRVHESKEVKADIKRKQRIVIGKTDKHEESGDHGKYSEAAVPSTALTIYRNFARELQKLRDDSEPFWLKEMPSGRINIHRVMRNCEVDVAFDRWTEQDDSADVEAVICIDRSGSMSSDRNDELASIACWIIKRSFEHIDAPVTVYSFDTETEVAYAKNEKAKKTSFKFIGGQGGTEPYDSLLLAEKLFMTSTRSNKMLFIITDGIFNVERNDEVIKRIAKRGVLTSVVLIMNDRDWKNMERRNREAIEENGKPAWELRHGAEIFGQVRNGADLVNFAKKVVVEAIRKRSRR